MMKISKEIKLDIKLGLKIIVKEVLIKVKELKKIMQMEKMKKKIKENIMIGLLNIHKIKWLLIISPKKRNMMKFQDVKLTIKLGLRIIAN